MAENSHKPSEKENLVEAVYASLLDAICSGNLAPGTRLGQEWVAERLGVSRQPVAQALTLMKSQGFVTEVGRRGLMVASLTPDYVSSMYEVRGAMDILAARLSAQRIAGPDGAAVRSAAQQEFDRLYEMGDQALEVKSVTDLIKADVAFHGYIYELSGNTVIGQTMDLLWNRMRWVMSAYLRKYDWAKDTWGEHREIVTEILAGNDAGAEAKVRKHLGNAITLIESSIEEDDALGFGGGLMGAVQAKAR